MTEKTLTTENIKPALDALRGELAPWPVVAKKQDRLNTAQLNAANSGITSSLVAQIIANTAAIRALESAITGTGLRALVVASLPAIGTQGILYIVPVTTYDPETDADVVNYSNEYLWIVAPDAPVTEGYYEQVGQTGIVINNGQLTITVNGTSVGTFTANQSGDTTAAITVPTNADYVDLSTSQTVTGGKTWTGEQSFTLPIVGSITGTASKAIADEDGTSIKTGYVNVAGNQTVSGQKTWSGNQFFTSAVYHKSTTYEIGNIPVSNVVMPIYLSDKNNAHTGYVRNAVLATGKTQSELLARNKFTNGALSPTGTDVVSTLQVEVQSNGDKTLYFDGSIRNNVLPYATNTYSLGSSSYQWSSVYAQTYYYNGTAWGLDKANVWTNDNKFRGSNLSLQNDLKEIGSSSPRGHYTIRFKDKNSADMGYISHQTTFLRFGLLNKFTNDAYDPNGTQVENYFSLYVNSNGTKSADILSNFIPGVTNLYNLGTSTNKWKTINGVNPGALSLPDLGATEGSTGTTYKQDVSGDLVPDAYNNIRFTPRMNGWVYIDFNISSAIPNTTGQQMSVQFKDNSLSGSTYACNFAQTASSGHILIFMPVLQNHTITLEINFTGFSVDKAYVYPCLGNV